jgi:broad specificity phosphatase PhoE
MTTTIVLIRHGAHDLLGQILVGRMPGVCLNSSGRAQAEGLIARLSRWRISAIHTSPSSRARETAEPLAKHLNLSAKVDPAFDEIDVGQWTGVHFDTLREDLTWRRWNTSRSLARCPEGESFVDVHARMARGLEQLARHYSGQTVAVFSHGDIIKVAICHVLGLPLDFHVRFDIDPASLSALVYGEWGAKLLKLNEEQTS